VKPDLFPSGVAKSVLTLFLVKYMNALDCAVVKNPLAEPPSTCQSNRLGGGLTALDRRHVENLDSLLRGDPVGNSAPRVVLRSAGHSELPQPPWRRRRRAMEVGKARFGENRVKLIMTIR
jgi:hypothetical protein